MQSYTGNYYNGPYSTPNGVNIVPLIIIISLLAIFFIIEVVSLFKILKKLGKSGWIIFVPIYNVIVLLQLTSLPMWYLILSVIPIANFVVSYKLCMRLSQKCGCDPNTGVLAFFLPFIGLPKMAFKKQIDPFKDVEILDDSFLFDETEENNTPVEEPQEQHNIEATEEKQEENNTPVEKPQEQHNLEVTEEKQEENNTPVEEPQEQHNIEVTEEKQEENNAPVEEPQEQHNIEVAEEKQEENNAPVEEPQEQHNIEVTEEKQEENNAPVEEPQEQHNVEVTEEKQEENNVPIEEKIIKEKESTPINNENYDTQIKPEQPLFKECPNCHTKVKGDLEVCFMCGTRF